MAQTDWEALLAPYLKPGQFLLRAEVRGPRNKQKVQIILDGEEGIGIEDCEALSRQLGDELDQLPEIQGAYTLEVSSPGADEPIQQLRQLPQHIGRELEITLPEGQTLSGELLSIEGNQLELAPNSNPKKGPKKAAEPQWIDFYSAQTIKIKIAF